MSFATANRTDLMVVKEVTWGTTPASPALVPLRYTGESISNELAFEKSKEIRSDRMLPDTILVDSSPAGSFNLEMSGGGTFDSLIESALMSAWAAQLSIVGVGADISTTVSGLSSGTAGKFTNVVVGQWIRLRGFTSTVNGFYQVSAKPDNVTLTLTPVPALVETPTGTNAKVDGSYLRNGTTEQSYTVVKRFADATTSTREVYVGQRVKTFSLDMQTASILTGSIGFMGKSASYTESAFSGETIGSVSTTDVMNCVRDVKNVIQDGSAFGSSGSIMSLSMELDNQHRAQKGIGVLGNVGVVAGQLLINCSASQYFESKAQADKFVAATAFAISYRLEDTAGNAYIITLPRCKYETFKTAAGGLDTDVMAETTFTATRDSATNCMIQIDRFTAP